MATPGSQQMQFHWHTCCPYGFYNKCFYLRNLCLYPAMRVSQYVIFKVFIANSSTTILSCNHNWARNECTRDMKLPHHQSQCGDWSQWSITWFLQDNTPSPFPYPNKITVFWGVMLCRLIHRHKRFGEIYRLHFQGILNSYGQHIRSKCWYQFSNYTSQPRIWYASLSVL